MKTLTRVEDREKVVVDTYKSVIQKLHGHEGGMPVHSIDLASHVALKLLGFIFSPLVLSDAPEEDS